jgi:hypothetical protein
MIPPEEVCKARGMWAVHVMASLFGINERTWRRWEKTGAPMHYGRHCFTHEEWRTRVDRHLSAVSRKRTGFGRK